jgi:hypothetical protein
MLKFKDCMDVVIRKDNLKHVQGTAEELMILMRNYQGLQNPALAPEEQEAPEAPIQEEEAEVEEQ